MTDKLRWNSNNGLVADREIFTGRVRAGNLEMVPDPKTGVFVGVHLEPVARTNTPPTLVAQDLDFVIGEPS